MSSFAATQRRRRPGQRLTKIPEPRSIERSYSAALQRQVLAPLQIIVEREISSRLRELASAAQLRADSSSWRNDQITSELVKQLDNVKLAYARVLKDLDPEQLAFQYAAEENTHHQRGFRRQVMEVLRVDPTRSEPWLVPRLRKHTRENVKLVKSLGDQTLDQIQDVVLRRFDEGARVEKVAEDIERRFEVGASRAELIAVDQIGKLHGQLTMERQQDLGVRRYRWRSARDERVRGNPTGLFPAVHHSHWSREGKVFRWDKPPVDGHAGEAIRCRCYAEPIFDGALAPIETRARAPQRRQKPIPQGRGRARWPLKKHPLRERLSKSYTEDRTAPTRAFERERFDDALGAIREVSDGRSAGLTQEDQEDIRRELNTLLAEEGLVSFDIRGRASNRGRVQIEFDGANIRAGHGFDGVICISPDVAEELSSGDPVRRMMGIRTLVHEATHGHSPITAGVYRGAGYVLEEATVEITARHVMVKRFGEGQFAQGDPWTVPGSYGDLVDGLRDAVSEILGGLERDAATARTLQAVLSMRSYVGRSFSTPAEYLRHFVRQFPESRGRVDQMATRLGRLIVRSRG